MFDVDRQSFYPVNTPAGEEALSVNIKHGKSAAGLDMSREGLDGRGLSGDGIDGGGLIDGGDGIDGGGLIDGGDGIDGGGLGEMADEALEGMDG